MKITRPFATPAAVPVAVRTRSSARSALSSAGTGKRKSFPGRNSPKRWDAPKVASVWSALEAHGLRSGAVARNAALTDNARTSEVKGAVTSAVNTVFSCNYADLGRTDSAARRLLTGKAVQQYATLFAPVRQRAPKDKLVLTTTVTDSGVTMLQGDRARVLIFADQRDTRTVDGQTTYAAAMLAVNAVRQDGTWKIDNIDTLTGTHPG